MNRFFREATLSAGPSGHTVLLDGKPLRTPKGAPLVLPSAALGQAVLAEWQAIEGKVDPRLLPLTRLANTAIDDVAHHRAPVIESLARHAGSDLLCYRAEGQPALALRQAEAWDPLVAWAEARHGAALRVTTGIIPLAQPDAAIAALTRAVEGYDAFGLTALHTATTLLGSLVLALALAEGRLPPEEAWRLSRLDEAYQAELWGADRDADARAARLAEELVTAARFLSYLAP